MNQGFNQSGAGKNISTVHDSGDYETPVPDSGEYENTVPDTNLYETPGHAPQYGRWNVCIILVLLCLYYYLYCVSHTNVIK